MTAALPVHLALRHRHHHHHSHHRHVQKVKRRSPYTMVPGPLGLRIIDRRNNESRHSSGDNPYNQQHPLEESERELKARMLETVIIACLVLLLTPLLCWAASNFVQNAYNAHEAHEQRGK